MIHRSPFPDVTIPDVSLPAFILERAERFGDKPALIDGPSGRTLTYAQLGGAIRQVAANLAARGFKQGDTFAIYSPNLPEYAVVFHAVALLGGVVTTVNPLYTQQELTHQLKDADARWLITVAPFLETALKSAVEVGLNEVFVFGDAEGAIPFRSLLGGDGAPPQVVIDPRQDLIVLPYSSGTTGLPKGVMLTHRNLVANIRQLQGLQDYSANLVSEKSVVLGLLPFYHIYGMVVVMNYALAQGAAVVTMPKFDLEAFLHLMQTYGVTYANVVPPIVLALAKHPLVDRYDLSALEIMLSGAAPLGGDVATGAAKRLACNITQGYGMTELSPVSHFNPDGDDTIDRSKVGPAIPNTECRLISLETGEDAAPGERGELLVRGPQMMKGYLNNPSATANTLVDGWLHTGDIAVVDEQGYFSIVDRVKELIKYKGFQVAPAELEALLLTHPNISDVAVIGSPDEEAGEVPKAFVVARGELAEDDVFAFVAERVAPYKKLRRLEFVKSIPKSASGKILRRVLIEQERAAQA